MVKLTTFVGVLALSSSVAASKERDLPEDFQWGMCRTSLDVFGLDHTAEMPMLKKRWKAMMVSHHPDKNSDSAAGDWEALNARGAELNAQMDIAAFCLDNKIAWESRQYFQTPKSKPKPKPKPKPKTPKTPKKSRPQTRLRRQRFREIEENLKASKHLSIDACGGGHFCLAGEDDEIDVMLVNMSGSRLNTSGNRQKWLEFFKGSNVFTPGARTDVPDIPDGERVDDIVLVLVSTELKYVHLAEAVVSLQSKLRGVIKIGVADTEWQERTKRWTRRESYTITKGALTLFVGDDYTEFEEGNTAGYSDLRSQVFNFVLDNLPHDHIYVIGSREAAAMFEDAGCGQIVPEGVCVVSFSGPEGLPPALVAASYRWRQRKVVLVEVPQQTVAHDEMMSWIAGPEGNDRSENSETAFFCDAVADRSVTWSEASAGTNFVDYEEQLRAMTNKCRDQRAATKRAAEALQFRKTQRFNDEEKWALEDPRRVRVLLKALCGSCEQCSTAEDWKQELIAVAKARHRKKTEKERREKVESGREAAKRWAKGAANAPSKGIKGAAKGVVTVGRWLWGIAQEAVDDPVAATAWG